MIILFIGTVGSGKTLSMTVEAYKYYKRGFRVFSNYHLAFPHTKLTKKVFMGLIEDPESLQNAVICLDEMHIWIDSRSSMSKKNKLITYFLLQTRKRDVRLLATTQHLHQVDKRLRDTADVLVYCENMSNKSSLVGGNQRILIRQDFFYQYSRSPPKTLVIHANPYFGIYNTREIVDFTDDDK